MKRCSVLLTIGEVRIETTVRYHLIPIRVAIIKKTTDNKCQAVEKRGPLYTVDRNILGWHNSNELFCQPHKLV